MTNSAKPMTFRVVCIDCGDTEFYARPGLKLCERCAADRAEFGPPEAAPGRPQIDSPTTLVTDYRQ